MHYITKAQSIRYAIQIIDVMFLWYESLKRDNNQKKNKEIKIK